MIRNYSEIKFERDNGEFKHNVGADFACFALWKTARPFRERIRNLLDSEFEILLETEIVWSKEHFHDNANRLYEAPIYRNIPKEQRKSAHAGKIGDNKFILFIVKDPHPRYSYAKAVSEVIKMSNLNVVAVKAQIREWILKDSGEKYGIHSTNDIYEFFVQAPLLLGFDLFERLLKGEKLHDETISKDLEGANGWNSFEEVFKILNLTSNYLVLRNFETLPRENPDKDIDFLTDKYQRLASALGAQQSPDLPYKGSISVGNERVSLDIRFIGDGYYDTAWQKDMLDSKECKNGVYAPREDHYFFSLLFHCKVQKPEVKEKYIGMLDTISKNLNYSWFQPDFLKDNAAIGKILNGYIRAQGYYYIDPVDNGVYKNTEVIKHLRTKRIYMPPNPMTRRAKALLKRILPEKAVLILKTYRKANF